MLSAAGTPEQIHRCVAAGAIPMLVTLLKDAEFTVQKEACWAISNLTHNGQSQDLKVVLKAGALQGMCNILTCEDTNIVLIALEGIENLLKFGKKIQPSSASNVVVDMIEECQGLDKLELLQKHPEEEVYQKSVGILTKFFNGEKEEEVVHDLMRSTPFGNSYTTQSSNASPFSTMSRVHQFSL